LKKSLVKTIATLALGMMIGSATLAAAAPSTIEAVLTKFKIVVNGQEAQLKNTPIVVKGTTYLPVREVAGLLNTNLNYDGQAKTIELTSPANVGQNTKVNLETKGSYIVQSQVDNALTFRDLVELLHAKYPDKKVSMVENGTLNFGDERIDFNFFVDSKNNHYVYITDVLKLNLLESSDL